MLNDALVVETSNLVQLLHPSINGEIIPYSILYIWIFRVEIDYLGLFRKILIHYNADSTN